MSKLEKQLDTFLRKKPSLGKGVYIAKGAVVLGDVTLGEHSSVWYNAVAARGHQPDRCRAPLEHPGQRRVASGGRFSLPHRQLRHRRPFGRAFMPAPWATKSSSAWEPVILDGVVDRETIHYRREALVTQGMRIPPGSMVLGAPAKVVRRADPHRARALEVLGEKISRERGGMPQARHWRLGPPGRLRRLYASAVPLAAWGDTNCGAGDSWVSA